MICKSCSFIRGFMVKLQTKLRMFDSETKHETWVSCLNQCYQKDNSISLVLKYEFLEDIGTFLPSKKRLNMSSLNANKIKTNRCLVSLSLYCTHYLCVPVFPTYIICTSVTIKLVRHFYLLATFLQVRLVRYFFHYYITIRYSTHNLFVNSNL